MPSSRAAAGAYPVKVTSRPGAARAPTQYAPTSAGVLQDVAGILYVPTATGNAAEHQDRPDLQHHRPHRRQHPACRCPRSSTPTTTSSAAPLRTTPSRAPAPAPGSPTVLYLTCSAGFGTSYALPGHRGADRHGDLRRRAPVPTPTHWWRARPASSAAPGPPVFGAACVGTPIHLGFRERVRRRRGLHADKGRPAHRGRYGVERARTEVGQAVLTRRPDGRVDSPPGTSDPTPLIAWLVVVLRRFAWSARKRGGRQGPPRLAARSADVLGHRGRPCQAALDLYTWSRIWSRVNTCRGVDARNARRSNSRGEVDGLARASTPAGSTRSISSSSKRS